MITERSNLFRYSMFGILYFVQGIVFAFTGNFAKPYLNDFGVDPDQIGLLFTLLLVPFIFKIVYGILSDRVNVFGFGHRLPYIVIAVILASISIASAGFVHPGNFFWRFAILILLSSFSVALFDTATDALAVDITPEEDQGTVQSIMTSGRAIGLIVMSLVIGWLATRFGYESVYITLAILMLLPLIWVFQVSEPDRNTVASPFEWTAFRELGRPQYLVFMLYGILASAAYIGTDGLVTFFMSDQLGAVENQIGLYGSLRGVGMVGGAFLTTILIGFLGRRTTAILILVLAALGAFAFSTLNSIGLILGVAVVWGVVYGLQWTIFMVLAMKQVDIRIAGSMFAISMAVSNIGQAIGEGVSTSLVDNIGFSNVFLMLAVVNIVAIPVVLWLFAMPAGSEEAKPA